jgi:hypothetical protein
LSRIWAVDLSSKLPSATLDAFDVTTNLIPREEWLPSNVNFHRLDVFETVAEEFIEKYDIVHIRFFSPVVRNVGPEPVIKTALQMLSKWGRTKATKYLLTSSARAWRLSSVGRARTQLQSCPKRSK